jgi:hypothetical protein
LRAARPAVGGRTLTGIERFGCPSFESGASPVTRRRSAKFGPLEARLLAEWSCCFALDFKGRPVASAKSAVALRTARFVFTRPALTSIEWLARLSFEAGDSPAAPRCSAKFRPLEAGLFAEGSCSFALDLKSRPVASAKSPVLIRLAWIGLARTPFALRTLRFTARKAFTAALACPFALPAEWLFEAFPRGLPRILRQHPIRVQPLRFQLSFGREPQGIYFLRR